MKGGPETDALQRRDSTLIEFGQGLEALKKGKERGGVMK